MTARTYLPDAEAWLAHLPPDLRRAAAIADPTDRAIALGVARMHAGWLIDAIDYELEECGHQADVDGQMPTTPRLRLVGGAGQ